MGGRGVGSMGASGAYGYKELRRTPSTSAIYETLRRSKELRESLTRPSSRLSMDEKIRDSVSFRIRETFFMLPSFLHRGSSINEVKYILLLSYHPSALTKNYRYPSPYR